MTLTIDLPPEEIIAIQARALAEGISAEQYVRRVVEEKLKSAPAGGGASVPEAHPSDKTGRRPIL